MAYALALNIVERTMSVEKLILLLNDYITLPSGKGSKNYKFLLRFAQHLQEL